MRSSAPLYHISWTGNTLNNPRLSAFAGLAGDVPLGAERLAVVAEVWELRSAGCSSPAVRLEAFCREQARDRRGERQLARPLCVQNANGRS